MDRVVWYMDWWHAVAFEILLTVAATCSTIQLGFYLYDRKHRGED